MTAQKKAFITLSILGATMMLPQMTGSFLAYIMASYPDVAPTTVTSILSVPALIGMFSSFAAGPFSLKINKKYLLIFSAMANVVYFAVFAIIGGRGPFGFLLAAAAISGLCRGSSDTLLSASIGEFFGSESPRYMAMNAAIRNGGAAVLGIIGGVIAAGNGGEDWPRAFLLGAICIPSIIAFSFMMPMKPEVPPSWEPVADEEELPAKSNKGIPARVFCIAGLYTLLACSTSAMMLNISRYIITEYQLGTSAEAGLANSIPTLVGVAVGFTYPVWAKLFKKWLVPIALSIITLGFVTMRTITTTLLGPYAGCVMVGFGFNSSMPYLMGYVMSISPQKYITVSISLIMGGMNLGVFLAPYVLNFVSGILGGGISNTLLTSIIGCSICATASLFLFVFRIGSERDRNRKETDGT